MLITALIFLAFIAILILGHEFGHFAAAKLFKLRVDEFAFGFPPKIFSKKIGETKYTLNAIPFGGFVKIFGENTEEKEDTKRSFYHQHSWKRALVIVAGVVMNFIIGWLAFSFLFFIGIPHKLYISEVFPGSPAETAGFKSGDEIKGFYSAPEFISYVNDNAGMEIVVNDVAVTPRENPPENEGKLGVYIQDAYVEPHGLFSSLVNGFTKSVELLGLILVGFGNLLARVFTGGEVLNDISGPVGIFNILGATSEMGFIYLVQLLGLLSLNLTIFNLLPFPALDGGRLLFIGIEKLIGRRLNEKYENMANIVGFVLLMLLAVTVTISDIVKLI